MHVPVPKIYRLKSQPLIRRWEELARYAKRTPNRPEITMYTNVIDTGSTLTAHRDHIDPSMVFFTRMNYEDTAAMHAMTEGCVASLVTSEFKVSTKYPFITQDTAVTEMTIRDGGLEAASLPARRTLIDHVHRALLALRTDALWPTAEDLDELLAFIRDSTPETRHTNLKP
jgi:hypothetical protein